jgi:hypothetical protein
MLAPNMVVGPTTRVVMGFPRVTRRTQSTNNVPFLLAYYRDTWHYPSWHSDLKQGGGQPLLSIPNPKDPGLKGEKFKQVFAADSADSNKVGKFC